MSKISIVIGSWGSYNECNKRALGSKWLNLEDFESYEEIEQELTKQGFELNGKVQIPNGNHKGYEPLKNKKIRAKFLSPNSQCYWRRRRDLNPRDSFSHPTPLAGEPLRPLEYFSKMILS